MGSGLNFWVGERKGSPGFPFVTLVSAWPGWVVGKGHYGGTEWS